MISSGADHVHCTAVSTLEGRGNGLVDPMVGRTRDSSISTAAGPGDSPFRAELDAPPYHRRFPPLAGPGGSPPTVGLTRPGDLLTLRPYLADPAD